MVLARLDDPAVLVAVAACLNCLSSWDPNKGEVCDRAVCTLVGLLLSPDPPTVRHAACATANLLESSELHRRFLEERGVPPLCALATSSDRVVRGEATRALANLAADPDCQLTVLNEGALTSLIDSLGLANAADPEDDQLQSYAALALANLATTGALQVAINV